MGKEHSFKNELEHMQFLYAEQKPSSILSVTRCLFWQAKHVFEKAKIVNHLRSALTIAKQVDLLNSENSIVLEPFHVTELFHALNSLYDPSVDDLIIIGALELYAKALLLKHEYVVHKITAPSSLKKRQHKQPISFEDYCLNIKNIKIGVNTIAISTILSTNYNQYIHLSEDSLEELKKVNIARNNIHFCIVRWGSVYTTKLLAINELGCQINKYLEKDNDTFGRK